MKIMGWVLAVCGLGVAMGQAPVGGKRAMTFADLMAMKRVSDPQVSAGGKWVLFSVTEVSLEKNTKVSHLWVVPVEPTHRDGAAMNGAPKSGERQVTFGEGETFGRFSPDGRWVSYSMGGQIWVAGWDEAAGTVGSGKKLTDVSGGADGAIWSPDSRRLMFVGEIWPGCSVKGGVDPTHDGEAVMNGAPGVVVGGTRANTEIQGSARNDGLVEAASWAEEDACDKARDEAVAKSAVKGQVWEGLFYRHWDQYTGEKRSHVLVVNLDGGGSSKSNDEVRDLTPAGVVGDAEVPTFSLGGPLGYAWAPDSKEVAYVANLDAVPAASTNNDVFTLRLDEVGAKAVKVSTSLGSDDGPAYSPDGKWLAFRSQERAGFESDRFRLMVLDREKGTIREVMPKFDRWVDEFVWAADSKTIYFAAGDAGEEPIFSVAVSGNELSWRTGFGELGKPEWGYLNGEFGNLAVSADGHSLVSTGMTVSRPAEIFVMHLGLKPTMGFFFDLHGASAGVPKPAVEGTFESAKPGFYRGEQLTHLNQTVLAPLLLPGDAGLIDSFWFVGAEGTKVQGFLLRPPGFDAAKKYPVKFVMHGGPQTALGDSWSYRWNWELMAASGYVVVGINRRGSTGYGQRFIDEVSGDWGGRAYVDLMKGLDYAEGHYPFIDKTRECALGASYGGFMADWVLTHTDRFKCIVTHDGMVDPVGAYGSTEELWFNEWEFRRPEDFPKGWDGFPPHQSKIAGDPGFLGGYDPMGARTDPTHRKKAAMNGAPRAVAGEGHAATPWRYAGLTAEEDPFRRWSPMRFIERAKTPTLVIHSQKDYRLDVSQGLELFTALQRLGVPSKMLYFPDEGHWVLKPQNSEVWYDEVGDWCDKWTKTGRYAER